MDKPKIEELFYIEFHFYKVYAWYAPFDYIDRGQR